MTTVTYRHGRGWHGGHMLCQVPTWREVITNTKQRPKWRALSDLRRAFPRRDLDIHHDTNGWYVRVVRISGNVTVSLHSGRRRRSLRDAVRVVIALRRKELAR